MVTWLEGLGINQGKGTYLVHWTIINNIKQKNWKRSQLWVTLHLLVYYFYSNLVDEEFWKMDHVSNVVVKVVIFEAI